MELYEVKGRLLRLGGHREVRIQLDDDTFLYVRLRVSGCIMRYHDDTDEDECRTLSYKELGAVLDEKDEEARKAFLKEEQELDKDREMKERILEGLGKIYNS